MEELEILISSAQAGHRDAREKIIERFRPMIIKTAVGLSGKFINSSDDEISIGMTAINQAIDTYNQKEGASFFTYAELIVKRRLIDYYRREQRLQQTVPFSSLAVNGQNEGRGILEQVEYNRALSVFQGVQEREDRQEEIKNYSKRLNEFGISFRELVNASPKHEDARIRAIEVAKLIAGNLEWQNYMETKKELPLKLIEKHVVVSRKTLERQRKYIIALTIILTGEYHYLQEYLHKMP